VEAFVTEVDAEFRAIFSDEEIRTLYDCSTAFAAVRALSEGGTCRVRRRLTQHLTKRQQTQPADDQSSRR